MVISNKYKPIKPINEDGKRILCHQGYIINTKDYTKKDIKRIRKDLKLYPYVKSEYSKDDIKPVKCYEFNKSRTKLSVPKHYGIAVFGEPTFKDENLGVKTKFNFKSELREYQKLIMEQVLGKIDEQGGGIMSIPTGKGKTVMAIYLSYIISRKTLVLCHTGKIFDQWVERIGDHSDAKVGKIRGPIVDTVDKDIVIAMTQSLSLKDYDSDIFNDFGLLIVDECHHIPTSKFSEALTKIPIPAKTIGLSATYERDDKMEQLFMLYCGDVIYHMDADKNTDVTCKIYKIKTKNPKYIACVSGRTGKMFYPASYKNIVECKEKNKFIAKTVNEILEKEPNRHILLLAHNIGHLEEINGYIQEYGVETGLYHGRISKKKVKEAESKKVILGTYAFAGTGTDIPSLNTIILAAPTRKIIQNIGRIFRVQAGKYKVTPLIIDIIDTTHFIYYNQAKSRQKYYKQQMYTLEYYDVNDDGITQIDYDNSLHQNHTGTQNDNTVQKEENNDFMFSDDDE